MAKHSTEAASMRFRNARMRFRNARMRFRNARMRFRNGGNPMSTPRPGLLVLLHRANQIATDQFSVAVGEGSITARQVQVLAAIEANEGVSQTRIVELTGIDRSTLADMIRRLQKNRLIERRRSKLDARAYVLKLTDAGLRALSDGKPAMTSAERHLLGSLTARAQAELVALLQKVVEHGASAPKR